MEEGKANLLSSRHGMLYSLEVEVEEGPALSLVLVVSGRQEGFESEGGYMKLVCVLI
jgi:hypothetical protein